MYGGLLEMGLRQSWDAQLHSILMAATISVNWIIKIRVIGYIDMRFTLRQLQVFVAVAQRKASHALLAFWPYLNPPPAPRSPSWSANPAANYSTAPANA